MSIGKELLKNNISVRTKTSGSSMLPFIRGGDFVVIRPIQWQEVKIGDILAYSNNGQSNIVCHRLVRKQDSLLTTKGDTHIRGYEKILPGSLLGKVICVERGRQKINLEADFQKFLASKIAWVSFNLPALLFIIAYFIRALRAPHLVLPKLIRRIKRRSLP